MVKIHKKKYIDKNVYEKAIERIEKLYFLYDEVVVSFSGGKDSSALLLCVLEVAKKLGKLPVTVQFFDEEAIHPPTIDYVKRVAERDDVNLEWYCLPVKHRNACSNEQPYWYCWDPEKKDLWVRDMPDGAIKEHPKFKFGMTMQDLGRELDRYKNVVVVQGLRAEESLRRYRLVALKKNDNYISTPVKGTTFAYPIYDWSSADVWKIINIKNEDYNKTYDLFNRTDFYERFLTQRVCPPYGEEPIRGLHVYAECFPEMWEKMINRVPGAATAARYGNTELYSSAKSKPEGVSYKDYAYVCLESYSDKDALIIRKKIKSLLARHSALTDDPVSEDDPHPLSGLSWKFICTIVIRGDFKDRTIGSLSIASTQKLKQLNITFEEAKKIYGKKTKR